MIDTELLGDLARLTHKRNAINSKGPLKGGMEGVWGVGSPSEGVGREKEPRTEMWGSQTSWPTWRPQMGQFLLLRTTCQALENSPHAQH